MSSTGPELPQVNDFGPSPLWPRHLWDLFFRPRSFFSNNLALGQPLFVALLTWSCGISNAIDRLDTELMREELGQARPGWERLGPMITESWWAYWLWVALAGAVSGLFLWWIGGWWYRVRLRWSGARDPDKRRARILYVYSTFVLSGPVVVGAIAQTALYSNYAEAYLSEDWFSMQFVFLVIVLAFLSIVTSYVGVTTLFSITKWKARVWFVVLPVVVYVLAFGLVAALYTFLDQGDI